MDKLELASRSEAVKIELLAWNFRLKGGMNKLQAVGELNPSLEVFEASSIYKAYDALVNAVDSTENISHDSACLIAEKIVDRFNY